MTTTELTGSTVLRRRPAPEVVWVDVDGEVVAWHQEGETLHLLDPIATLIFQLCDGTASLEQTTAEIAGIFGREPGEVGDDIRSCVARLEDDGLVEVVR